jgi:FG-GAP-like repeat
VRALAIAATVLTLSVGVSGAGTWEETRKGVIDPLNGTLHRRLPSLVKARDLEALLGLYVVETGSGLTWDGARRVYTASEEETLHWDGPAGSESIRERYRHLLDLFAQVERAELRIDQVDWRRAGDAGLPVTARLLVRGVRPDGAHCQLEQRARLHVVPHDKEWRIASEEITGRTAVARKDPRYDVVTESASMTNVHDNATSPVFRLFGDGSDGSSVGNSGGSAVADVDGDGCEDAFLAGSPGAALFRNNCDGSFRDVTADAGLPVPYPAAATGAVFFDYDNDGRPDLYIAAVRGGDRLFHNVGDGRFEDATAAAGIPVGSWASMAVVADYDRDGFLDIYVVRMGDHENSVPQPNYAARNGIPGTLLHNQGDGTFADVTSRARVGHGGWDMAGAWGDYDDDGWPDLYLANEFGGNVLYRNQGDGTFADRTIASGTADGGAGMGVAWADYDGDGDLDLYVSTMHANSGWALFHPDFPVPVPWKYRVFQLLFPAGVQRRADRIMSALTRGSTLFRNEGNGTFTDVSDAAGVRDAQWGWAAEFLDYDDDGRLDLYAVNGFVSGPRLDDV